MPWSQSRKTTANRLASIIYGSIATMTADLGIKATDYTGMSLSGGLAAVTAAAIFTKFFLEIVKRETETGIICRQASLGRRSSKRFTSPLYRSSAF